VYLASSFVKLGLTQLEPLRNEDGLVESAEVKRQVISC